MESVPATPGKRRAGKHHWRARLDIINPIVGREVIGNVQRVEVVADLELFEIVQAGDPARLPVMAGVDCKVNPATLVSHVKMTFGPAVMIVS